MTPRPPSILIVDDVPANLIALEAQLGSTDVELIRASSGNEALRQLLKRDFAVMLLDVQMPEMDGYEVARFARENPRTCEVPIIFVTAMHDTESNLLRSYGAGAVDVLFKPVDPYILRSKVRVFLDLYRGRQKLADEVAAHQKTYADLEVSNAQLVHASRVKSDFLSMMSHELRTPLNAILGFSELLQDQGFGALNERQEKYVSNVHDSGTHLLNLINDLLDLSKVEAGHLEVDLRACDPRALAKEAVATLQHIAVARNITLVCDSDCVELPMISVDPLRMKQVLYNLLSNAIKFTPPAGSVSVSFRVLEKESRVRTIVSDTGLGISFEDRERLFKPFSQLETALRSQGIGTGLGLSLTRKLVELMGGQADVQSFPGQGSHFFVNLPIH